MRRFRTTPRLARAIALACLLVLLGSFAKPERALAIAIEFTGRQVKLDILALYDSRREKKPHLTRIHKFAEMPLNYLGYRVVYQDVNAPLPSEKALARYRGILTWFVEPLQQPELVLDWLERALGRDLKYVVLGEPAPPGTEATLPKVNRLLARLGLKHPGDFVDLTWRVKVTDLDPEMIGFERPLDKALPGYPIMVATGGDATPHLELEAPGHNGPRRSIVVATSQNGGFVAPDYTIFYEPNTDRLRWILNPFAFFARAFGGDRHPIPDVTTLAGRRLYFSHIDGDGWNNVSDIQQYRELQRISAEVIEREAIVPYPDLPVSVGLIAGDVEPGLGARPSSAAVARRLFALPQVEVASHSYTHPFDWQFFEHYDRAEELRRIEQAQSPSLSIRERFSRRVLALAGRPIPADAGDKYVAGSDDLPRTYLKRPFDLQLEMTGALRASEALAPKGKSTAIYLWSGDTTPFPAAIRELRKAGVRNMNGGDSRLDPEYPSVAYVPPIGRPAGTERQIYAGNSNENTYTNDWTGPYYGFSMLDKTLDNTETPRRLKPFNLYYHMYSGEKPAALAAVRRMLERARHDPVIPVKASDYAAIADDFFSVGIVQVDLFSWAIANRGALSTVRFDNAEKLALDIPRSDGVLGATRHAGSLYVALDPSHPRSVVTLRGRSALEAARRQAEIPASLVDSRWRLSSLVREACGFRVTAEGFGSGDMTWQTSPRRAYRVTASRAGTRLSEETRWADDKGLFHVRIAPSAIEPLQIDFACHE
ncbi:MAG: hypothetical protein R3D44_13905 [Hyphomicrobiaceae bacterium]